MFEFEELLKNGRPDDGRRATQASQGTVESKGQPVGEKPTLSKRLSFGPTGSLDSSDAEMHGGGLRNRGMAAG